MSDKLRVLICCGAGASSGFIAQAARKAAAARGSDQFEITARSEAELNEYLPDSDVVLLGPHLEYMKDDAAERARPFGVSVAVIPQIIYGTMDGNGLLDLAVATAG
ncbi:PTS sugar transporter subunit IIB [Scrofimicrobium sp. R131]|uniref:PTS sugar transporter subunit IIB n=1 Tax=Scrofimicrobium appendicitidis TaxID=3079930 RepID=A0AAU7V6V3_9ACTO